MRPGARAQAVAAVTADVLERAQVTLVPADDQYGIWPATVFEVVTRLGDMVDSAGELPDPGPHPFGFQPGELRAVVTVRRNQGRTLRRRTDGVLTLRARVLPGLRGVRHGSSFGEFASQRYYIHLCNGVTFTKKSAGARARGGNRVRPEDHRWDRGGRHRRGPIHRRRGSEGRQDRRGPSTGAGRRAAGGRRRRDDRCHGKDRGAGLRGHPHPLRRAAQLGQRAGTVQQSRGDDRRGRQLWRRVRAGAAGQRGVADRADGGRRGHSRDGADRGHHLGLGELRGVPRRDRPTRTVRRLRQPDRPRHGARVRDGGARRPQRARHRRGHRGDEPIGPRSRRGRRTGLFVVTHHRTPRHGR